MRKLKLLLAVGIIFTLLGCGTPVSNTPTKVTPNSTPAQNTPDPKADVKQTIFEIGDTFKFGDLQYKINSVRTSSGTNQYMKPKNGNTFLLIEMTIENQGSKEAQISSMLLFKLVDMEGRSQDLSIEALSEANGKMDGSIAPSRKMTGELGYQVPAGPQTFELEIKTDLLSSGTAIVKIPIK